MMKYPDSVRSARQEHVKFLRVWPVLFTRQSETDLYRKPTPNKWSKAEIMGHLIDSARVNIQRFLDGLRQGSLKAESYHQDEQVKINKYQQQDTGHLIQLWVGLNNQLLHIIQGMDEAQWTISVEASHLDQPANMAWLYTDYVSHLAHHGQQIFPSRSRKNPLVWHIPLTGGEKELKRGSEPFHILLQAGDTAVELYKPEGKDLQTPHDRDEIYVIVRGEGVFSLDGHNINYQTGDLLYVPAGYEHRFESFSDDFLTWVIFFGPKKPG